MRQLRVDVSGQDIDSVLYIRCINHLQMPQINEAESFGGECGECIRQQCWKDIIGLIDKLIPDLGRGVTGKGALTALKATLQAGIGTFGVADELEAEHNRLSAVLPKPEVRS